MTTPTSRRREPRGRRTARSTAPGTPAADPVDPTARRSDDTGDERGRRRRASRSLWAACEAVLSPPTPRAMQRALAELGAAFDCDGVAIHVVGRSGVLEPWCARGDWQARPGDLRDCLTVPLVRGRDVVGSLDLRARSRQTWTPSQLGLIRTAAGALGAAMGARLELERLRNAPGRDSVTGLPDARAFQSRLVSELDRCRRHGHALGLVIVDLDHFEALNTRYGRDVGDEVIAEAALVIRLALRESDVLARLGGDAFGVLLPEADLGPARRCAERLRHALEEHRFERVGRISASIGVAASPRCGLDPLELMSGADGALSQAKKSGRRRVVAVETSAAH